MTSPDLVYETELAQTWWTDQARKSLLAFTLHTFPAYQVNWHHREMCKALDAFARGEIKRLIIEMPPRHGKSEVVSRRMPSFLLGIDPDCRVISASYNADLARAMNRDVQRIVMSPAYRELFPETSLQRAKADAAGATGWVRNADMFEVIGRRGGYRAAGVGGGITGMGGDKILIDDPIKNEEEAASPVYREKLWGWYTSTLYTRLEKGGGICITATRWHEDDLVGRLRRLAKEDPDSDQWVVISFPAICENDLNVLDPRQPGEPLWPEKYDLPRLNGIRSSVGARVWASLYQQRPSPEHGLLVRREWWRYYHEIPKDLDIQIQAWDLTFTDAKNSDFVCGVVMGRKGVDIYLLDLVHDRLSFTQSLAALQALSFKWPEATAKYVEQAANGHALIDALRGKVAGLIAVRPLGSKVARVNGVSPVIEAGNVYLPHPSLEPRINDLVEEWTAFPSARNDDRVDAMTHAIAKLMAIPGNDWAPLSLKGANLWKY